MKRFVYYTFLRHGLCQSMSLASTNTQYTQPQERRTVPPQLQLAINAYIETDG
jgi:hypothetical protein